MPAVNRTTGASETGEAIERLPPPETVGERLTFAAFRAVGLLIGFSGLSLLTGAIPAVAFAPAEDRPQAIARSSFLFAFAFLVGGGLARHLATSRRPLLANERTSREHSAPLGGWLLVLTVALCLVPLSAFYELAPLRSLWADMLEMLRENGLLEGALKAGQNSGLVMMPVIATMIAPLVELATAAAFAVSSLLLLPLLSASSWRFPRAFLICVLIQAALMFASIYGAEIASQVSSWVVSEMGRSATHTRTIEDVRALEAIARYNTVLASTSRALLWAFAAYAIWLIPLLGTERARETFAPALRSAHPIDEKTGSLAVAGMSDEARRRFYADAARTLQQSAGGDSPLQAMTIVAVIVSAVMGAIFAGFSILGAAGKAGIFK
jgi:hypothetical protein